MAIKFLRSLKEQNFASIMYMPTTASTTYTAGMALVLNASGTLVKASGTTAPTFICQADYVAPATGMEDIPVEPTNESSVYLADKDTGDFSGVVPGEKLTLSTDGTKVTATTTSGVYTVDEVLDDEVRGRFV